MNAKIIISSICILLAICLAFYFYTEWQKQRFDAALPTPPPDETLTPQSGDESLPAAQDTGGHWHGDEWHADDTHLAQDDWQPSTGRPHEAVKPEGLDALDADDPVAKAWAKLDELADNPFAWGGNADPRTPGLIAQLMPPPEYLVDEAHGEQVGGLLDELAYLRDPRSIETLTVYECGDNIGSAPVREALVAMGPSTVPYLIPSLDEALKAKEDSMGLYVAADVLSQIGAQHRADLDGIIEHIILPKFEQLLANESLSPYGEREVQWAIAALKR